MGLVSVTIEGLFSAGPRPTRGVVWFTLAQRLVDGETVLDPVPQEVVLDSTGALRADLFTLEDTATAYWVQEDIRGVPARPPYLIGIRPSDSTLNLNDLTTTEASVSVPPSASTGTDGGDPGDSLSGDLDGGYPGSVYDTTADGGAP